MQIFKYLFLLLFLCSSAFAQQLSFKRVLIMPGYDDVNTSLAPEFDNTLQRYLKANPRFQVVKADRVNKAFDAKERSYPRVMRNREVHKKAIGISSADVSVILYSRHRGKELVLTQEWRDDSGRLAFTETQAIASTSKIEIQKQKIFEITDAIIDRIPYKGEITGKTGNTITLDLNENYLTVGDEFDIVSLDGVKRHPYLKTIINADYHKVGTARVSTVDSVLVFAKITSLVPDQEISVGKKIINIKKFGASTKPRRKEYVPAKQTVWKKTSELDEKSVDELKDEEDGILRGDFEKARARYGHVSARLQLGSIDHEQTISGVTTSLGSFALGAALEGQLWITKVWIFGLDFALSSAGLEGERSGATVEAPGSSWTQLNIYGAYRHFVDDTIEATNILFGMGYQITSMKLPTDTTNFLGNKKFSGVLFKVQGNVSLMPDNRLLVGVEIQPFGGVEETGVENGDADSATALGIDVAWNRLWKPNLWWVASLNYSSSNASFSDGDTITEKRFAFGGGLKYAF